MDKAIIPYLSDLCPEACHFSSDSHKKWEAYSSDSHKKVESYVYVLYALLLSVFSIRRAEIHLFYIESKVVINVKGWYSLCNFLWLFLVLIW